MSKPALAWSLAPAPLEIGGGTAARAAGLAAVLLLGACTAGPDKATTFDCPRVVIDKATSSVTHFRPGDGHDITDIEYEAEITGFQGMCGQEKADKKAGGGPVIGMALMARLNVTRGPALKGDKAGLDYFVAVAYNPPPPQEERADPDTGKKVKVARRLAPGERPPERRLMSKQTFRVETEFPKGIDTVLVRDEEVEVQIPLGAEDNVANYEVYVGLQLTAEELEHNLSRLR